MPVGQPLADHNAEHGYGTRHAAKAGGNKHRIVSKKPGVKNGNGSAEAPATEGHKGHGTHGGLVFAGTADLRHVEQDGSHTVYGVKRLENIYEFHWKHLLTKC